MRYICDGWDIYVIYVCMNLFVTMEYKKIKNYRFGSLCWVLHSAKDPVAECHGHSTRQSWKNGFSSAHFSSFVEWHSATGSFAECNTRQSDPKRQFLIFLHSIMTNKFIQSYISSITYISHSSHIYLMHHIYISSIHTSIRTYHIHPIPVCRIQQEFPEWETKKLPFWVTLPSVALGKGPRCRVPWPWYSAKNFF